MLQELTTVTIVVPDYDQAIAWYTQVLGFSLIEDSAMAGGKRWVVVAPAAAHATRFLLARAASDQQQAAIGNQTGGRVGFFLNSDDFQNDFQTFSQRGVRFLEDPRHEPYGWVVQFADPWGNKYDLLQAPNSAASRATKQIAGNRSPPEAPSAESDARSPTMQAAQHSESYVSSAASRATKQTAGNRSLRYGFVGIIVPHELGHGPEIQRILGDHAELIQGRMGLPHLEEDTLAVITLIVRATPDELGSLTGRLGRLKGVTVKSGLAPLKDET